MTRRELTDELTAGLGGARHEARFIVDEVFGPTACPGVSPGADEVPAGALSAARAMARRRAAGEPLQYVFGHWPFRHLDLFVDRRVLIPRPETEQVVEVALAEGRRLHRLADSDPGPGSREASSSSTPGRGAGPSRWPWRASWVRASCREVWATDVSALALDVAATNVEALRASCGARRLPRIELAEGSWLEALPAWARGAVDLVVANPPYVSAGEWAGLAGEVRAEPRRALVAGPGQRRHARAGRRGGAAGGVPGLAGATGLRRRRAGTPPGRARAAARPRRLGYDEVRVESDLAGRPRALVVRAGG